MKQFGELRTCNRCGKTEFVEANDGKRVVYDETTFAGWKTLEYGGDLCDECVFKYYDLMNEFLQEEERRDMIDSKEEKRNMIDNVVIFNTVTALEKLTGLSRDKLGFYGFDLDDWDIGFQTDVDLRQTDLWWLIDKIEDYGMGPTYTNYKGKFYCTVHHA